MKTIAPRFLLVTLAAVFIAFIPKDALADASTPWSLRNLYKIPVERGVLVYAEDNAEWRVLMDSGEILADRIGFSVVLEDGTEIKGIGLPDGESDRERISTPIGDGIVYSVTFPEHAGLRIVHSLRTFNARPFVFVDIAVENIGSADVQIAEIRPVIAETSVMQALSAQATVRHRRVSVTGGQPVHGPRGEATMAVIHDPAKPISFGVGLVPQGLARPVVRFSEQGGEWHGDISCHYEPYKTLKPGETLVSDPLWISHGVPEPDRVDLYYSWVYSTMVNIPDQQFLARGWYTLGADDGLDAYLSAGAGWKDAGIDHVLLGTGWEGRPGSMEGAASRFPKSMKQALGSLESAGIHPGVTIDPLSARDGGKEWTATSSDGLAWIDPRHADGQRALAEKITELKGWGSAFVVVAPSRIPDDALSSLGLTRSEAQHLAYEALRESASPMPVFPASVSSVTDDPSQWLDAGSSVARMAIYGMDPGPLQWALNGSVNVTPDLLNAVQFWPGPIEFSGTIGKKDKDEVLSLVNIERVPGQPMDAERDAPRTWNVQKHDESGNLLEERTISVGGADVTGTARADAGAAPDSAS